MFLTGNTGKKEGGKGLWRGGCCRRVGEFGEWEFEPPPARQGGGVDSGVFTCFFLQVLVGN